MKAALFDLDGVLIDTEGAYYKFWKAQGDSHGLDPEFANKIKGTTLAQILDQNFDKSQHARIVQELEEYEENMVYEIFPHVEDYLRKLQEEGIPAAIVTSSNDHKLSRLWQQHPHFKDYFKAIVSDGMVTHSKPDPEPYLVAAKLLGIDPKDCCVFEDSYNGLISGRRAGATVVALSTTNPADTLIPYADKVIPSFMEI